MQFKAPIRPMAADREDREHKLREFVQVGVAEAGAAGEPILLVARCPDSLSTRLLFALSAELAASGVAARIVFAGAPLVATGEAWNLSFDPAFRHEIRLLRDPRYLDGHEQMVVGTSSVWFGDSMRREMDKRDAFSSFIAGNPETAGRARVTFERLWTAAEPLYQHQLAPRVEAPAPALANAVGIPPAAH